jgi:polyhydroxybutyrate depolymerase
VKVFVPSAVTRGETLPFVIALHGGLGSGEQLASTTQFEKVAEREGFIVAFPDGIDRTWNGGRCCNPAVAKRVDDVGYLAALIEESAKRFPVDRGRVYMTGHSNGGIMSWRFACERPDLVVAIVPVAGSLEAPCPAKGPGVALLSIHGDADRNLPLEGGRGERSIAGVDFTSQAASMAAWNKAFECSGESTLSANGITTTTWPGCRDGVSSQLTVIAGADHPWPGSQDRRASSLQGTPTQLLDATEEAWQFFAANVRK